ncbi:hypothetical protein BGX27_000432 [Mortierella sp. AM989]|nr:hypothetical protein BGX27_000432 [Mortierella sp. AM989]
MRAYGIAVASPKWPLMLRLKGTVILQIWWQNLVSVMGMVVSLLLVFRTNTAYGRYWEGRRLWSQMILSIRNLTRGIWVCVDETEIRDLLEKKSAINLLVAFAFATKHYLREEYGYNYSDMIDLLAHIPKYSIPTSTQPMDWRMDLPIDLGTLSPNSQTTQRQQRQTSQMSSNSAQEHFGASFSQNRTRRASKQQELAFDFLTPTNIPMELSYYIGSYIKNCSNRNKADPATMTLLNNGLVMMTDCLTGFERILRTPIPLAYSIHLHHVTWIYLLALPFQLIASMGPAMIPATMLAAFTLLGILGIGYEIENPFDDDYNDLPLDDFCKVIQAEVNSMVATRAPVPSDWIFSEDNYPLSRSDLSAKQLCELTLDQVHALMATEVPHFGYSEEHARKSDQIQNFRPVAGNNIEPSGTGTAISITESGLTRVSSTQSSVHEKL